MDNELGRSDPYGWSTAEELTLKFLARLSEVEPDDIGQLEVAVFDDRVILMGQVFSDSARSSAIKVLSAFLRGQRIEDKVEVTGVFEPAADRDWFIRDESVWKHEMGPTADAVADGGGGDPEAVQRHPWIHTVDALVAGTSVTVLVDLTVQPRRSNDKAMTITELPSGWGELEIDTRIASTSFESIGGHGRITIREDGSSDPASFSVMLKKDLLAGQPVEVSAVFHFGARYCGLETAALGMVVEDQAPSQQAASASNHVTIAPGARQATMNVTIIETPEKALFWTWSFKPGVDVPSSPTYAMSRLDEEARTFAAGLMERCPEMHPSDLRNRMGSIGEKIWNATPPPFQNAYLHMLAKEGPSFPIQFVLNEFHVPWEMMRPPKGQHLYLSHPVARWLADRAGSPQRLPDGERISFVPRYETGTLPAAVREQDWLHRVLGAIIGKPAKAEFLKVLEAGDTVPRLSLLHFAGHGSAATQALDASLCMEDEPVHIADVDVSYTELGERDRCLVVLNACETASSVKTLSWVEGWAPTMAMRGFGAVVAPLWRVQDEAACELVTHGLEALYTDGMMLGEAFTQARAGVATKSSAAFAFLAYGDVMARVGS